MTYWVAGATVVGAVGTAVTSKRASDKAAGAAGQASDATIAENRRQFDLVRGDTAGQRFIGDQALGRIAQLYGYGSVPANYGMGGGSSPTAYSAPAIADNGFFNTGAGRVVNPWTVTSKLGSAGKILDPAGGLIGNMFGNTHGDEKRNINAFVKENQIMDLGNGMLQMADGTQFREDQLKDIAGTWYGATYAPDGNQAEWQGRYTSLIGGLPKAQQPAASSTQAAGTGKPDMSVFFESPDYQFNLSEALKAGDRSLVARGRALSGQGYLQGQRIGSGLASREYGSFIDRLYQQAGLGATGIGASASAGANAVGNISQAYQNAGDARASAYMVGGRGMNNAIQGGVSNLLLMRYLQPGASFGAPGYQANNWGYGKPMGSYA